jgi:hypothetical protein
MTVAGQLILLDHSACHRSSIRPVPSKGDESNAAWRRVCHRRADARAPARSIQELAGHQDLMTTQRYMHLSPAALDAAIRLLDAGTAPATRGAHGRRREREAKTRERIEERWWRRRELIYRNPRILEELREIEALNWRETRESRGPGTRQTGTASRFFSR